MGSKEIRHKIMHTANGNIPTAKEVKDWAREDGVEFPCRSQIRPWVREELLNRWRNFGLNYTHETGGQATNYPSMEDSVALNAIKGNDPIAIAAWDKNIYKGPKTSWARVTSSAIVTDPIDKKNVKQGFILMGNGNFHDTYGFDKGDGYNGGGGDARTLLGYDITGKEHWLDEPDYKHRPSPGVVSVESEDIDPGKNFRRTTINFTVWSQAQLDYMDAYFFQPGISAIVEWGWNTYPREALLQLNPDSYQKHIPRIWNNEKTEITRHGQEPPMPAASKQLRLGQGNYGYTMGLIHSFTYSIRADGGYDCTCLVSCMSEIGRMIMTETGRKKKNLSDGRQHDIRTFTMSALRRLLVGNSDITGSTKSFNQGPRGTEELLGAYKNIQTEAQQAGNKSATIKKSDTDSIKLARGRYFSFDPYSSSKPYYAASPNEGTYITVGYLLDIFNIFFARTSEGTHTKVWEVSCWNSRAIAHPNIKSIDGDVLLIPNSLAPRWNQSTYEGSSISVKSTTGQSTSASYNVLQQGTSDSARNSQKQTTQAFLNLVKQMTNKVSSSLTLEEAMQEMPRDDLHRILAFNTTAGYNFQHPAIAGKLHTEMKNKILSGTRVNTLSSAYEEREDTVRPFPDYASPGLSGPTLGYSGRIADLFVNLNVVDDGMATNHTAEAMILDIMKKVSAAVGDLWDFQLIGADTNTSSNVTLQLIDANFSGTEDVSTQKETALVFPTHRGDSIVREMSLDVDPKSELSSQIVFGNLDDAGGFYAKEGQDLILKHAKNPADNTVIDQDEKTKPQMPDKAKYIVSLSSKGLGQGALGHHVSYKTDGHLDKWDISYKKRGAKLEDEPIVLTASDQSGFDANLETARKEGDESSIATAGNQRRAQDFGQHSTGLGDIMTKQTWQIYCNSEFFNRVAKTQSHLNKETKLNGPPEKFTNDMMVKKTTPIQDVTYIQRFLVGKTFSIDEFGGNGQEVIMDLSDRKSYDFSETEDKKYKIIAGSYVSSKDMLQTKLGREDPRNQWNVYRLTIQEEVATDLSPSEKEQIYNYQQENPTSGEEGRFAPPHLLKKMKKHNISQKQVDNIKVKEYLGTNPTKRQVKITTRPSESVMASSSSSAVKYGTTAGDPEIDVEMVDPDRNRMLDNCKVDRNAKNNIIFNQRLDGVEMSIKLDGIEGLRLYDVFNCSGVPARYFNNGVFAIAGVKHSISGGDWTTDLECMFFPG